MDSLEVCGQPHLRAAFVFRPECFGLRLRHFSSAPDLFPGSFGRTASLNRQKIAIILDVQQELRKCGVTALGKTDAPHQIRKSRVAADCVEEWMYLEKLQNIRLFLVRLLEPRERLLSFSQS